MLQLGLSWEELMSITTAKHSTYQEVKAYTCHLQLPEFDSWCETLWTPLHFLSHHYLTKQEHIRNWNAHTPEYYGQTTCAKHAFSFSHYGMLSFLLQHLSPNSTRCSSKCSNTKPLWCLLLHPSLPHTCKALSNTWHQQVKYSGCWMSDLAFTAVQHPLPSWGALWTRQLWTQS